MRESDGLEDSPQVSLAMSDVLATKTQAAVVERARKMTMTFKALMLPHTWGRGRKR